MQTGAVAETEKVCAHAAAFADVGHLPPAGRLGEAASRCRLSAFEGRGLSNSLVGRL
jgi:hypothetical protein